MKLTDFLKGTMVDGANEVDYPIVIDQTVVALDPDDVATGKLVVDARLGNVFTYVPEASTEFEIKNGVAGQKCTLVITTSGTSSFDLTHKAGTVIGAGTLATGTADAKTFVVELVHNGTKWVEVSRTEAM